MSSVAKRTPVERLLMELIAIPSVNPSFLPKGDPRAGEQRAAEFLAGEFRKAGLEVELREMSPGRPNLVARLKPTGRIQHTLVLGPHLDTVGGETSDDRIFQPIRKGSRIFGRGACDTKGSASAMAVALLNLSRVRRPRQTEILFCGFADEEDGQGGSRAMVKAGLKADLAIVGEPTRLEVITAHKGDIWFKLKTKGKAAHGAKPHLGINAVLEMARAVQALEVDYAKDLKKRKHPLLGSPTVNVGAIKGGRQPNIVPAECEILVDRRTLPGETERSARAEMKALFARKGLKVQFENTKAGACDAMETDPTKPWVARFMAAAGQKAAAGVDFFCDAAVLSAGGIPSLVFGPGDIAQAHTADEWISTVSLNRAVRILEAFLDRVP